MGGFVPTPPPPLPTTRKLTFEERLENRRLALAAASRAREPSSSTYAYMELIRTAKELESYLNGVGE